MKMKFLLLITAFVALTAGIAVQRLTVAAEEPGLPRFELPDLSGDRHTLDEWKGKVLVVNFWATWCPPCREEIPEFVRLQQELGEKGLQFVGIAIEDREPVEEFADRMAINYPVLIAENEGIALSMQMGNVIGALPYSVVIDRKGRIVHSQPGAFSREQLLDTVSPLL